MPDRLDPEARDAVCELVRQKMQEQFQIRDLERERQRSADAAWRAELDSTLAHLVKRVEGIHDSLNDESSGARPRVRMLEEMVRVLQDQLRTYSRALWIVGAATVAAIVKHVADLLRFEQP